MSILRSQASGAGVLLGAAILGLVLANTTAGPWLLRVQGSELGPLATGHWISDGLLAVFFFTVAIELKHELVAGELNSWHKAVRPAIAAVCGVAVPAGLYLAIAGTADPRGWPIPTATDIAFALGVLAIFGRGLPNRLRVFLLALAVLDDLIAIVIIAVFFTATLQVGMLVAGALGVAAFGGLSYALRGPLKWPVAVLMVIVAVLTWWFVHQSGIHATIAGVSLGFAMRLAPGRRVVHALEPWVNGLILPLFAFSAALVVIPAVGLGSLAPPFWAIVVALPVGKVIGITIGGLLGRLVGRRSGHAPIPVRGLLTLGALGGIGFTVSLLMNELSFQADHEVAAEGTLAVLLGSGVAIVASAVSVTLLARWYRLQHPHTVG